MRTLIGFVAAFLLSFSAWAQDKVGVVLMHGKQGSPANLGLVASALESRGALVVSPSLPWGAGWQSIKIDVPQAHALIQAQIAQLQAKGATRIVLAGHSLGANMALSYAVINGGVAGVVMLAPGHNPAGYANFSEDIRKSVAAAKAQVDAGKGADSFSGLDNNQGTNLRMSTTAAVYLSWLEPRGPADMMFQARRLPATVPILVVIGDRDPLFQNVERLLYQPAAKHPYSKYITKSADHRQTAEAAPKDVADWVAGLPR